MQGPVTYEHRSSEIGKTTETGCLHRADILFDVTTIPTAARVARQIKDIGLPQPDHIVKLLYEFDLPTPTPRIIDEVECQLRGNRFNADSVTSLVLEDPALLAMLYQHASCLLKQVPANPYTLISELNSSAIQQVLNRLREASIHPQEELQPWLCTCHRHSMAVSQIAAMLSPAMDIEPGIAAAAGLLHDLGRLLLLACPTGKTALATYDLARNTIVSTVFVESLLLGLNHKQLGYEHCRKLNIPAIIMEICETHEHVEAQRNKLRESDRKLADLIHGCDQIVKACGLAGSPSSELNHASALIEKLAFEREGEITRLLDRLNKDFQRRLPPGVHIHEGPYQPLHDIAITFLTSDTGRWNPYQAALEAAGASILHTLDLRDCVIVPAHLSDSMIMVIDATDTRFDTILPVLAELDRSLPKTPVLMLTSRTRNHGDSRHHASPFCHEYATPIRSRNLAQAVLRLKRHT